MSEAITLKALADELDLSQKEVKAALTAIGADAGIKGADELDGETADKVRAHIASLSVADATGDSSEPAAAPSANSQRVRVLRDGPLQMEMGELIEEKDGRATIRLTAPNFAGGTIELNAGEWERV
jgi:hypothetical protein